MDNHHFGYSVVFIMDNQKSSIIGATDRGIVAITLAASPELLSIYDTLCTNLASQGETKKDEKFVGRKFTPCLPKIGKTEVRSITNTNIHLSQNLLS